MNLSAHFTLAELIRSDYAVRRGIDNTPTAEIIANLTVLANGLEEIRDLLGRPIYVSSGYRSPKVNSAVGGSKTSDHMQGWAADFTCPQFGNVTEICHAIMDSPVAYHQLIHEFGSWVHISFNPDLRRQNITATSVNGKANYTNGIE